MSQVAFLMVQQRAAIEVEDLGEFELKGVADPLRLFSAELVEEVEVVGLRDLLQEAIAAPYSAKTSDAFYRNNLTRHQGIPERSGRQVESIRMRIKTRRESQRMGFSRSSGMLRASWREMTRGQDPRGKTPREMPELGQGNRHNRGQTPDRNSVARLAWPPKRHYHHVTCAASPRLNPASDFNTRC